MLTLTSTNQAELLDLIQKAEQRIALLEEKNQNNEETIARLKKEANSFIGKQKNINCKQEKDYLANTSADTRFLAFFTSRISTFLF
jgi:hypothetical protein